MVLTPDVGDAATTSWPFVRSLFTSFVPISPLPPITTIFIHSPFICCPSRDEHCPRSLRNCRALHVLLKLVRWSFRGHFTGMTTWAPLSLTKTTRNFAGSVLLAFRLTT